MHVATCSYVLSNTCCEIFELVVNLHYSLEVFVQMLTSVYETRSKLLRASL